MDDERPVFQGLERARTVKEELLKGNAFVEVSSYLSIRTLARQGVENEYSDFFLPILSSVIQGRKHDREGWRIVPGDVVGQMENN